MGNKNKAVTRVERRRLLLQLEDQLDHSFANLDHLNLALIHKSYANEHLQTEGNNERLEFLGDSILGMVISEYLFQEYPFKKEGELARLKSFLVQEDSLVGCAQKLNLAKYILLSRGEESSGGRKRKALLADAMEAVIAAIYLDSGYEQAKHLILKLLASELDQIKTGLYKKDFKSILQEFCHKNYQTTPVYQVISSAGLEHSKTYTVEATIAQTKFKATATGVNIKEAERKVAEVLYLQIAKKDDNGK